MTENLQGSSASTVVPGPGRAGEAALAAFVECVVMLAQRRLRQRIERRELAPSVGATAVDAPFLSRHRAAIEEHLRAGVVRALHALEIAARGETLWNRIAASWPHEPRHQLLPQTWGLRDQFTTATAPDRAAPAPRELAAALQRLRHGGGPGRTEDAALGDELADSLVAEVALRTVRADAELQVVAPLLAALRDADEGALAQLLEVQNPHGELLLAGLVDYFTCRALQADPRLSAEFVFVHVARPQELWAGELDVLARLVEQQCLRLIDLLDDQAPLNGSAARPKARGEDELERLFQQGLDAYLAADYRRAITRFSAALGHDPNHLVLYAYRGDAYRLLCEYDRALADYTAALRLNPATASVLVQRAAVYRCQGEPALARADCSAALAVEPQHAGALLGRGDAQLELGEVDAAIADYTGAIALQPLSPWGYLGRAQAYCQQQAHELAVTDFNRVLEINPHHVPARLQRGDACCEQGNLAQAIADYSEVLRYHPRNAAAYRKRGFAFEQDGDLDRAIADYSQALRLDPVNARVYQSRGTLLRRKGELDRALADLDESIRHDADLGEAHYNRGLILMARGRLAEASAAFDAALRRAPTMIAALLARALAQDALGYGPEGVQDCGRALEVDEQCAAAYLVRGVIGSHMGQFAQALADLTRTIDMDPNLPLAFHERGMVHMLLGDHEQASADYSRMLELNPSSALAYAARGIVRQLQGDQAQALADFARALELNPRSILAGLHQNTADGMRRRTTQLLVDYIEGLWHEQQRARLGRQRKAARPAPAALPGPDGATTAEHPVPSPALAAPKPRRRMVVTRDTDIMPAAGTEEAPAPARDADSSTADSAGMLPVADLDEEAGAEERAGELLLASATDEAPAVSAAPATTELPAPVPEAPAPTRYQCPSCRSIGEPLERLPDRRVRCANCKAAFLPSSAGGSAPTPVARRPAAALTASPSRPKPKQAARSADANERELRFTLKQKLIFATAAAAVLLLAFYYLAPSLEGFGGKAPAPFGKRITADDLVAEFMRQRKKAAAKYLEQDLAVSGDVADVSGDLVRFRAGSGGHTVEATFRTATDVNGLQKDQKALICGECAGWHKNGNVRLINCKVFPYEAPPPTPVGILQ